MISKNYEILLSFTDLAVAKVFSEEGGVLGFVKHYLRTMSKDKPFQDATKKAFDLFVKIINIYPEKVKNFAEIVVIVSWQFHVEKLYSH